MILYFFNFFFQDDIHGSKKSGNEVSASFYLEEASSKISAVRNDDPGRLVRFKGAVAAVGAAAGVLEEEGLSRPGMRLFRRGLRLSISPSWSLFTEILFEADFSKPFYNKVRK